MEVILLIIIGIFLIYRMMRVEERMNRLERDVENHRERESEKQFWAEQPPYPFATDVEIEQLKKEGKL
jgi:hypothetical protein